MKRVASVAGFVVPILAALGAAFLLAGALSAQDRPAVRAELVRQVMSSPDDGEAWSALETEATEAAEGPFLLRALRFERSEGAIALDLGGYGLPILDQSMKTGARTRVVVTLPGARSALPHGFSLVAGAQFDDVRVRQVPDGVEVEATLPEGVAAIFDETADGVRVRAVAQAVPVAAVIPESRFAADEISVVLHVARTWLVSFRAGRPLALFPAIGIGAFLLLMGSWFLLRRRSTAPAWLGASDAQRLADRLLSQAH